MKMKKHLCNQEWADVDKKKKGKSKGGANLVDPLADKSKAESREAVAEKEKYNSTPVYQSYMTKLMRNRGLDDKIASTEVQSPSFAPSSSSSSKRFSVMDLISKAEVESKSGETSRTGSPVSFRASPKKLTAVKENTNKEKDATKTIGDIKTNNKNKTGCAEKHSELKTGEEKTGKSGEVEKPAIASTGDVEESNLVERLTNAEEKTKEGGETETSNNVVSGYRQASIKQYQVESLVRHLILILRKKSTYVFFQVFTMSKGAEPKTSAVNKTVEVATSGIGEKKTEEKAELEKSHEEKPTGNKKANNSELNDEKPKPKLTNNKVAEKEAERSNNGSPVNFRASLRPPKGQRVIQ